MAPEEREKLENLVRCGQVRFITIDANVVRENGLALKHGLLSQLTQFNGSRFSLTLSAIVIREVQRHIAEFHRDQLAGWPGGRVAENRSQIKEPAGSSR
ncbi:hypothetical protein [Ralstonia solanacearum]|uniref:DUF4935 domain-containing protein n=1 Tax=Ralstonia solanacearum CFBP2957 TaxID=859656 RepID=D8P3E1_RALSL|nr:hypothetical protein [Ralstonia solanacearum]CBJ53427.1 protein of unknown function [Ralstonia solanacearum CFBP2957]